MMKTMKRRRINESIKDIDKEGKLQDWGTTLYIEPAGAEMSWKDVYFIVRYDCRQYPLLEKMIGVEPGEKPTDRQIRMWIKTKPQEFLDYIDKCGIYCDQLYDDLNVDEYDYSESTKKSTKKSGRKFVKESDSNEELAARKRVFSLADELKQAVRDYVGTITASDEKLLRKAEMRWENKFYSLMGDVQDFSSI